MHELEAILSEEPANPDADDEVLSRLASQAEGLEDEYKAMIARLTEQGTKVVLYGTDDHTALIEQFRSIGLSILGPSQEQLRLCQEHLRSALEQTVAEYQQVPFRSPLGLYRQALSENGTILSQDAEQNGEGSVWIQSAPNSPSNFVNLESMTLMFEYNRRKLLFLGDMQLADPNVDVEQIRRAVRGLRRVIKQRAPFDFVKLAHHGSDNGFNAQVLADWMGSGLFGICGGSGDPGHPNPRVLRLLNDHRGTIRWVRTDRNGRCSITFGAAKPAIEVERGRISDPRPNASSLEVSAHVLPETGRVRLTITV
jgi:hypothetical protein